MSFKAISAFAMVMVLLSGSAQALRLTDGLYFTVPPNGTQEVYFILPDDVGTGLGKADYFITTATNWSVDLTEQLISTEENNTAIIPIKFYSAGRKEGECSNYTVSISAPSLQITRKWSGGVCLSKYMDVDISKKGGDAKDVLNNNVDLFSVGFGTYAKNSRPGGTVPIEILVQSQASLTIDITLQSQASLDRRSFAVQTSQGSQRKSITVNASASSTGDYEITVTAKARNCSLSSCTKQSSMRLVVSENEPQEGFAISLFPENLAVKSLEPVQYAFTLQNNYGEERIFAVNIEKSLDLDSSFILDYVTVPGLSEKSVDFNVTPRNQTGFYEIKVVASSKSVERMASAYLSVNEMVSDAYRNADDVKANASASTKAAVDKAVNKWYSSYSRSDGSNTTGFASLQEALDAARKQNQSGTVPEEPSGNNSGVPDSQKPAPNYLIYLLPAALGGAVLIILLLLRKRKTGTENIKYLER
jgi:hypothetical protein